MEPTEPAINKIEDIAWDALEGELKDKIPEININLHQCDHSPEHLVFDRTIYMDTYKVAIQLCTGCGQEVPEYIPLTEDDMS
ncbi:hypothetical protein ACFL0O_00405 [Thermodesulfobacteriota bacterium]